MKSVRQFWKCAIKSSLTKEINDDLALQNLRRHLHHGAIHVTCPERMLLVVSLGAFRISEGMLDLLGRYNLCRIRTLSGVLRVMAHLGFLASHARFRLLRALSLLQLLVFVQLLGSQRRRYALTVAFGDAAGGADTWAANTPVVFTIFIFNDVMVSPHLHVILCRILFLLSLCTKKS